MTKRAIIRLGDPTSHGGTVLEAFPTFDVYGKRVSGVGHKGFCPLCKTTFHIIAGAQNFTFMGQNVAVEGMMTSCGATLIATQHEATIDDGRGSDTKTVYQESVQPPVAASVITGVNTTAKTQSEAKWVRFHLNEVGSCEGMTCQVQFDDGSVVSGQIDANNQVEFKGFNANQVTSVDIKNGLDNADNGSITELLISRMSYGS